MSDALKAALKASVDEEIAKRRAALEILSIDQIEFRKAELLGDARSLNELSEAELLEYHHLCREMIHRSTTAGKPPKDGGAAKRGRKAIPTADLINDFG